MSSRRARRPSPHSVRLPVKLPLLPTLLVALLLVAGCSGIPLIGESPSSGSSGGYYGGDRPPPEWTVDPDSIPDAVPRHEPLSATGNQPYTVFDQQYRPLASAKGYVQSGTASWYGKKFHGRRTSSGEPYDMFAMTAAHPVLPLPSYVRVTNLDNGRSVVVKVNDRGPFLHDRLIDLSYLAAHKLDIARHGTGRVEVRAVTPDDSGTPNQPDDSGTPNQPDDSGTPNQPAAGQGGEILIQVGAYALRDNARAMRQLLERAGYRVAPLVDHLHADGERWLYRVRVGPFANREQAQVTRQRLESLLGRPVAVVTQ